MLKKIFQLTLISCLMLVFTHPVHAASLELKPATGTVRINDLISLDLILNVATGEQVWGYETKINYPTDLVSYRSSDLVAGQIFSSDGQTTQTVGSNYVVIGGYFNSTSESTTTKGVVATLKFNALAAGNAVLSMVCDSSTNIYSPGTSQTNIFTDCATLSPRSTITINSASSAALTPTATSTPAVTQAVGTTSGQISQLPTTGALENAMRLILLGGGMLVLGGLFMFGFSQINR